MSIKTERRNLTKSRAHYKEAVKHLPLGVSSNFRFWGENETIFVKRGKGARLWDLDGVVILAGVAARQAQGGHHGLGAGVGEAHQLRGGHHLLDQLGNTDLALGAEREHGADALRLV